MSRFEDLQAKGWVNLTKEEREEYQKLKEAKAEVEAVIQGDTVKQSPEVPEQEDKMTVTRAELQQLINEGIQNYRRFEPQQSEKYGVWEEVTPEKNKFKKATLRLWQKDAKSPAGLIVRADYLKTIWNEETHKHDKIIYEIEVLYDDGNKEVLEMDALDFSRINQIELVELVDVERKKMRSVSGKTGIPIKDAQGYPVFKMNAGGYGSAVGVLGEVDLEVIKMDEKFKVRRQSGQEFTIESKYLNS